MQYEPGVRGTLADPAVGDRVLAEVHASLVAVERAQLVIGLERAVVVGRLGPGDVLRGRDVAAPLGLLLRQVGGREEAAGELVPRAGRCQGPLRDRREGPGGEGTGRPC